MKKTYRIKISLLLALLFGSCQKYLDVTPTTKQSFITTADDCQLLVDNYTVMNTGFSSDAQASSDDYFLTDSYFSASSALSQEDKDIYSWKPTAIRQLAASQWQTPYQSVYFTNLVLEAVDKLKGGTTDPTTLNALRGSALFYRSFVFWTLAQQYIKPYSTTTAGQDPGIPLRTSSDMNDVYGRGTVQQTYDRIVQDLQEAASLLPATSVVSSRPNKAAAYAMLARTYLSMGNYAAALTSASSSLAINSQLLDLNTVSQSSNTPFSPRFSNKEILFQAVMFSSPLLSAGSASNAVARINPDIVGLYESNDLRKQVFLKPNRTSAILSDGTISLPDGTYRFSGNYEPVTSGALFVGLATDEVYLIRAECYARAGNVNAAMTDLNTLLSNRYVTDTYVNMTAADAADALSKVLTERRKELLMRGLRWTDLRRLNLAAVRMNRAITFTGSSENPIRTETVTATYNLNPGDARYTLLIPKEVINASGMVQNAR